MKSDSNASILLERKMSIISESNESDYLQMKAEFENKEKTYQESI